MAYLDQDVVFRNSRCRHVLVSLRRGVSLQAIRTNRLVGQTRRGKIARQVERGGTNLQQNTTGGFAQNQSPRAGRESHASASKPIKRLAHHVLWVYSRKQTAANAGNVAVQLLPFSLGPTRAPHPPPASRRRDAGTRPSAQYFGPSTTRGRRAAFGGISAFTLP